MNVVPHNRFAVFLVDLIVVLVIPTLLFHLVELKEMINIVCIVLCPNNSIKYEKLKLGLIPVPHCNLLISLSSWQGSLYLDN